jgi:hypothetical protein
METFSKNSATNETTKSWKLTKDLSAFNCYLVNYGLEPPRLGLLRDH